MIERLIYKEEPRTRTAFYASDFLKPNLDLYFTFTGEPKTNPPVWTDTLKWGAGVGVEAKMVEILKMNGIVQEDYDQKEHGRIDMEREGIKIHGYIDVRSINGTPIEVKSVNNKNAYDVKKYTDGYPRENYVGQLSIYLDATGEERGYLFVATVDGLSTFWLECKKIGPRKYKCGKVTVDLDKEYKRWANLYHNHIVPGVMPDIFEYRYKYPVDQIDFTKLSKTEISKIRNGHKVLGDWQVLYSSWKDKIIQLQGEKPGYSNEEMAIIMAKTEGYTTWKK